jgi:hypothetical protein
MLGVTSLIVVKLYIALHTVRMLESVSLIGLIRASSDNNKSGAHDDYPDVY